MVFLLNYFLAIFSILEVDQNAWIFYIQLILMQLVGDTCKLNLMKHGYHIRDYEPMHRAQTLDDLIKYIMSLF